MDPKISSIFENPRRVLDTAFWLIFFTVERGKFHKMIGRALLRDQKEGEEIEKKKIYEAVDKISSLKAEITKLRDEVQKKMEEKE